MPAESELEALREENAALAEQVKRLVQTEARLYAIQELSDEQRKVYRTLAEAGRKLASAPSDEAVFEIVIQFVVYGLRMQRCLVLTELDTGLLSVRASDGYYTEAERETLSHCRVPLSHPLISALSVPESFVCTRGDRDAARDGFRALFMLDEFVVVSLGRLSGVRRGIVVAGNLVHNERLHTPVQRDRELIFTLESLANHVTTTLENVKQVEELRAHSLEVERANRMKSAFLAMMSHELRTPLNAIIGFTRIVLRKTEELIPTRQAENLRTVERSAKNLLTIINDLLDISKVEAGRLEIFIAAVHVTELVREVVDELMPLATGKGLFVETVVHGEPFVVQSDAQRLRQVVTNLLSNAIKFTRVGSVSVHIAFSGVDLCLDVVDTGIGMPEEELSRIFEPFHQVESGRAREAGGTGLGLAIAKELTTLLGGTISVESRVGEGTTFHLLFPRAR